MDTGADPSGPLLDQYKLATEMADRLSARRGTANAFYFTVASALLAASEQLELPLAAAAGITLAGTWWLQLLSYRKLSAAKWQVINGLEASLPARPFTEEWEIVKTQPTEEAVLRHKRLRRAVKPLGKYAELSLVEQVVPVIFAVLFTIILVCAVA
jgi:hypothetical protein